MSVLSREYGAELQKLLLQSLITDSDLFVRCQNILSVTYFDSQFRGTVKFVLEFAEKYNSVPSPEQIKAHCNVELEKLDDFTEQYRQYYLDEIENFCKHKALVGAIMQSADLIEKGEPSGVEQLIKDAILVGLQKDLGTDYFADPKARLLKLKEQNGTISTGWKSVDEKLYNIGRGELLLFLALSGGGKSVFLQNISYNFLLQGLNVLYITLELSEELCGKRIDSMTTDVAAIDIFKKLEEVDQKVRQLDKKTGRLTLKKFPASTTCTRDIRSYLKEYEIQYGYKPDALVLDYIDLMCPNDKRINPSDVSVKDKFIAEEIRNLAVECKFTCISASQLNRSAGEALEFEMHHVAGGKVKIDSSDNVIAIRSGQTLRDRGEIQLEFLKTRNSGGVGSKLNLSFNLDTLRVLDLDEDTATERNKPKTTNDILNRIKTRTNTEIQDEDDKPINSVGSKEHTDNLRNLIDRTRNK